MSDSTTRTRQRSRLDPQLKTIIDQAPKPQRGLLVCSQCGYLITTEDQRIAMLGQHQHLFTNPYGYQFQVGCFQTALGCAISGQPTHADTWFPGHFWRLATCSECQTHLGWSFEDKSGAVFYGLILPRLQARDREG